MAETGLSKWTEKWNIVFIRHCWVSGTKIKGNKKGMLPLYFQYLGLTISLTVSLMAMARNSPNQFFAWRIDILGWCHLHSMTIIFGGLVYVMEMVTWRSKITEVWSVNKKLAGTQQSAWANHSGLADHTAFQF